MGKPERCSKFWILLALSGLFLSNINAQESIAASGGNATGSGGTVSYTIGQTDYITGTSTSGTVIQGVQQPYEIEVVSGFDESDGISLDIVVFPNPASDHLKLIIVDSSLDNLRYQLFDNNGILIQAEEIRDMETIIQTGNLLPASYYLKVCDLDKEIITFKIIKK